MNNRLTYQLASAFLIISLTLGYNLEDRLPIYKKGPNGSTFGFSVALHKTTDNLKRPLKKNILVVGAPTADALSSQGFTHKPGGIFYCPLTPDVEDCKRVKMDEGDSTRGNNKTGQWLGVSLKSQGPGKHLITCAHRHSSVTGSDINENQKLCGKCFLLDNTNKGGIKEISVADSQDAFIDSPCKRVDDAVKRYHNGISYAQSGTDIAFHGDKYLLGAPGAWSWTGAMFDFTLHDITESNWHTQFIQSFFQTAGCSLFEMNQKVERCTNIPVRRDSYMGFSVATSDKLIPDSNETVFLAGAPRGNFTGAVVLYQRETRIDSSVFLSPLANDVIMGTQMGSSFGYSVTTSDVNGDGFDDIIVGAPQYYQYSDEGKFGGAVYVYLNTIGKLFSKVTPQRLVGPPDSFFGYSIAPLGDLDQDGYSDFAVGAPYEGSSGKVHIFRGQPNGKVVESQILNGKNYKELGVGMTAFGISLNGDIDIDNNNYPDLLIGTLSDQAILFRTRPTISVNSSLMIEPDVLDLSKLNCKHKGENYSCFKLTFCLSYTSRRDEFTGELVLEYKLILDSKRQRKNRASRAYYGVPNGPTVSDGTAVIPDAGQLFCPIVNEPIFFNSIVRNKLQPITIDLKYWLATDNNNVTRESVDQPIRVMLDNPILNADYKNELIDIVPIKNDCGDDGCQSDLKVNGSLPSQMLIGGDRNLQLRLEISNDGEEAHQAYVTIKLPPYVYYENFTVVTSSTGHDVKCFTSSKEDTTILNCIMGNPYPGGGAREVVDFNLDVTGLTTDIRQIVIEVTGSTSSNNPLLNPFFLICDVIVEMSLSLKSYGRPQQLRYSNEPIIGMSAIEFTSEIGSLVEFTFNIKNEGFPPAEGVEFVVNFPYEIENGKWLFYLETARVIGGYGGYCEEKYVNELMLNIGGPTRNTKQNTNQENSAKASGHDAEKSSSIRRLQCKKNTTQCVNVICKLEPIQGGATVSVKLQSRLWKYTFLEEFVGVDLVIVETMAHIRNVDNNVRIKGNSKQTIETTVDSNITFDDVTAIFPWWYIVIAIAGALLIYVTVILCLFRCGFFKRQRYRRKNERPYEGCEGKNREHQVREHSSQI